MKTLTPQMGSALAFISGWLTEGGNTGLSKFEKESDLDALASQFLRENGEAASAVVKSRIFRTSDRRVGSGRSYVPIYAFTVPAKKTKTATPCVCVECGGPRHQHSGQRCGACYKAQIRRRFIERTEKRADRRAGSEVARYMAISGAFDGDQRRTQAQNPWLFTTATTEQQRAEEFLPILRAAMDEEDAIEAVNRALSLYRAKV